jgi:hydroxymethylpyrimidine pyrophosphatase-like HAD family hydrolase
MKEFSEDFSLTLAGEEWLDCMPPGMNKGVGLKLILEKLGISPEETMAFGDYHNDLEMLKCCRYGYAMKNAHPYLLNAGLRVTRCTNDENGVLKTLQEYFDFL